jgi:hypothetical protein
MSIATSKRIVEMAKAGYPALYLLTTEDMRAQREIKKAASELNRTLYTWTLGKGLVEDSKNAKPVGDTETPNGLLEGLRKVKNQSIVVLRLFHHFLDDPLVQSFLLDLLPEYKNISQRMIIITTPVQKIPMELEKEVALVEMQLPDKDTVTEVLDGIISGSGLKGDKIPSPALKKVIVGNACGMTTAEAENAFALSLIRGKASGKVWDPEVVMEEKCATLKKTGLLEYIPEMKEGMKAVGGMQNLKLWAAKRKRAWTPEAKTFGLPAPKGVLMVGIPGSGKSLSVRAIAEEWKLPLVRLDMGKIFGSLVGQSEANMRMAIQVAEAVAPCILWVDEIEKGLAGTGAGQSLDSGVGARILGTMLTWMQEKTSEVFVCATANDVTALPPELLRKGRFDEMFSVLLPNKKEREEIFHIHIEKRGRVKLVGEGQGKISLKQLADRTEGYSGAEIEAAVVEALYSAFDANKDLNSFDLIDAIDNLQPLSKTMAEKITRMEEWCKGRARPANGDETIAAPVGGRMVDA